MKQKFLLLAALAGGGNLGAQAQQLTNSTFDNEWVTCYPYVAGKHVTRARGTQPDGWTISNVDGMGGTGATEVGSEDNSHTGHGKGVKLTNTPNPKMESQIVPAYLTLGTTWSTSKVEFPMTPTMNDGGTFGGINFTNKPDAITFDYKTNSSQAQKPMVIAYLWSGSWSQANVPTEIKLYRNPKTETMVDRDRNILGLSTSQGGAVTNNNGVRIASMQQDITAKTNDWETATFDFTYDKPNATPEKLNIIFSAGNYFVDATEVVKGLTVSIDNVKLVYYHELLSVRYNGSSYAVGSNNEVDLSSVAYDPSITPEFTKKGVGATIQTTFDENTQTMKVEVFGNDYNAASNPNSKTTYTLKFAQKPAQLSNLIINGANQPTELTEGKAYITVRGEYDEAQLVATSTNPKATIEKSYDTATRIATITVNAKSQPQGTYFVKYAKEAEPIESKLVIGMGDFLDSPVQGVEITKVQNGTVDLQLLNFEMPQFGLIGDIFVTEIPYKEEANGTVKLYKKINDLKIFGSMGDIISGKGLPLELEGQINKDKSVTASLKITWNEMFTIVVRVYPTAAASIDATGISGVNFEAVRDGLTNPNALIYADADATGAAANDIVDGTCANLTIADGNAFHALKPFTATQVSYDRAFKFGNNNYVSSFVLPFDMHTNDVDGKVYKFNAVNGDNVNFTEVTGQLGANTPYLIVASNANPFSTALANEVQIAATPETMEVTASNAPGFAHIGSYNTTKVTSGKGTTYYGYTGGNFVKAKNGTLNPFRTLIKATGTTATQFSLKLDGEVTGIIGVNTELGKVDVYNLEGKLVRSQVEAATALQGLEKGVYVINGKKVMK